MVEAAAPAEVEDVMKRIGRVQCFAHHRGQVYQLQRILLSDDVLEIDLPWLVKGMQRRMHDEFHVPAHRLEWFGSWENLA